MWAALEQPGRDCSSYRAWREVPFECGDMTPEDDVNMGKCQSIRWQISTGSRGDHVLVASSNARAYPFLYPEQGAAIVVST